jgi:hypothetical protein
MLNGFAVHHKAKIERVFRKIFWGWQGVFARRFAYLAEAAEQRRMERVKGIEPSS